MLPWLWFWAPQLHLPLSGDVAQRIEPHTHWFFAGIRPAAGDAGLEERAFHVASYGKQLGKITEVLLDLASRSPPTDPAAARSLGELRDIRDTIERLKADDRAWRVADVVAMAEAVRDRGDAEAQALRTALQPVLAAPVRKGRRP